MLKKLFRLIRFCISSRPASWGKLIQANADKVYREAPFAMLQADPASGEDYVVRGLLTVTFFLIIGLSSLIIKQINSLIVKLLKSVTKVR